MTVILGDVTARPGPAEGQGSSADLVPPPPPTARSPRLCPQALQQLPSSSEGGAGPVADRCVLCKLCFQHLLPPPATGMNSEFPSDSSAARSSLPGREMRGGVEASTRQYAPARSLPINPCISLSLCKM